MLNGLAITLHEISLVDGGMTDVIFKPRPLLATD